MDLQFFEGKKILVTGHTGFKGSWMSKVLINAGAKVTGYALEPFARPNLFELSNVSKQMDSVIGDIRDLEKLQQVFDMVNPEIVIHMAAQPLVRESYRQPVYTYDVNVMGTVNILECIRKTDSVRSFVNVTTDKVYLNREWEWGYRENEELKGYDPYSNSKSCSELVTYSYKQSFFDGREIAISTARAGNVIGGGDFAVDRIIPDCIRAARSGQEIIVRNPDSTRPYQHVLEPVVAYLLLAEKQYLDFRLAGEYNIGPNDVDCWTTGDLVTLFCQKWNDIMGTPASWKNVSDGGPHEANFLKLDCSKARKVLGWKPLWNVETAMEKIIEWNRIYLSGADVSGCMDMQINEYLESDARQRRSI